MTNLEPASKCLGRHNAQWAAARPIIVIIVIIGIIVIIVIIFIIVIIVIIVFIVIIIIKTLKTTVLGCFDKIQCSRRFSELCLEKLSQNPLL